MPAGATQVHEGLLSGPSSGLRECAGIIAPVLSSASGPGTFGSADVSSTVISDGDDGAGASELTMEQMLAEEEAMLAQVLS